MNKEKVLRIIKSKIFIGVACFILGGAFMSDSEAVTELENSVVTLNDQVTEKDAKINELQAKVDEAKPWFDMQKEEQAKLDEQAKKEKEEREAQEKAEAEAKAQAELEAKTVVLGNGNFTAGVDFVGGVYDIIAVSGGGNISSSNMYNGGINAIMGSDDKIAEMNAVGMGDMYKKEYKNIKLPEGTELKVDGLEVKLVPKQ